MEYICNIESSKTMLKDETFKNCIGSGHAYLTMREDYRNHVRMIQKDINFRSIRFHAIFHDLVGIYHGNINDVDIFNFQNIFKIFDFFIYQGLKPFVELSFMPKGISSGNETIFKYEANITPPRDYKLWNKMISRFVRALITRYGRNEILTWKFEVWNEPDAMIFWTGGLDGYLQLYKNTALTLKSIDPEIMVGGPATSKVMWIQEILDYCSKNNIPMDFISTHHYCCDISFESGFENKDVHYRGQHIMKKEVKTVYQTVMESEFKDCPIYFTEWNVSPIHEDTYGKDSEFTAVFALTTLKDVSPFVEGYSYWTISDIFEESGPGLYPFSGKYGLISINDIKKPIYHAYKFLNDLYPVELEHECPNTYITKSYNESVRILIWNMPEVIKENMFGEDYLLDETIMRKTITFSGLSGRYRIRAYLVDKQNGNALTTWKRMGKPQYLDDKQINELKIAEKPTLTLDHIVNIENCFSIEIKIKGAGFIFYDFEKIL